MTRKGRRRKSGQRKPSGDLRRLERGEHPNVVALCHPHRRGAPLGSEHDQRAETPLGILNMIGAIRYSEFNAARRYARIVRRYREVIDAPNDAPASIAGVFEPQGGGNPINDAAERKFDYDGALEALGKAGRSAQIAVNRLSLRGEPCAPSEFPMLMRGLIKLREHFDLTDCRKSATVGNRP